MTTIEFKTRMAQLGERIFWTFVQTFLTYWIAADTLGLEMYQAAALAGLAAALNVLAVSLPDGNLSNFWLDLCYRIARTYVVALLTPILAAPVFQLDFAVWKAAAIAALPAALVVLKGAIGTKVGDPESPAILPRKLDCPTPVVAELNNAA